MPACDSVNFTTGFKELSFKGSWDFEQHLATWWNTNRVLGQCILSVKESTNDVLNGEKLTCDFRISCGQSSFVYGMNISIPFNDDRLEIFIYDESPR